MASTTLKAFLRDREAMVHLSKPVLENPEWETPTAPRGWRPSAWKKHLAKTAPKGEDGKPTEIRQRAMMVWKGKGDTRTSQRAAKDWLKAEERRLRDFLKERAMDRRALRCSFYYIREDEDMGPHWRVGLFEANHAAPFAIKTAPTLGEVIEGLEEMISDREVVYIFTDADLEVDRPLHLSPIYTVTPPTVGA